MFKPYFSEWLVCKYFSWMGPIILGTIGMMVAVLILGTFYERITDIISQAGP